MQAVAAGSGLAGSGLIGLPGGGPAAKVTAGADSPGATGLFAALLRAQMGPAGATPGGGPGGESSAGNEIGKSGETGKNGTAGKNGAIEEDGENGTLRAAGDGRESRSESSGAQAGSLDLSRMDRGVAAAPVQLKPGRTDSGQLELGERDSGDLDPGGPDPGEKVAENGKLLSVGKASAGTTAPRPNSASNGRAGASRDLSLDTSRAVGASWLRGGSPPSEEPQPRATGGAETAVSAKIAADGTGTDGSGTNGALNGAGEATSEEVGAGPAVVDGAGGAAGSRGVPLGGTAAIGAGLLDRRAGSRTGSDTRTASAPAALKTTGAERSGSVVHRKISEGTAAGVAGTADSVPAGTMPGSGPGGASVADASAAQRGPGSAAAIGPPQANHSGIGGGAATPGTTDRTATGSPAEGKGAESARGKAGGLMQAGQTPDRADLDRAVQATAGQVTAGPAAGAGAMRTASTVLAAKSEGNNSAGVAHRVAGVEGARTEYGPAAVSGSAAPAAVPTGGHGGTNSAAGHPGAAATFERMDGADGADGAAGAPQVIGSGPQRLAVGVRDAGLGWVEIRTHAAAGQVSAVVGTSAGSHPALAAALPSMREYLAGQQVRVDHLAAETFSASSGGREGSRESGGEAREGRGRLPAAMTPEAEPEESRSYISVRV